MKKPAPTTPAIDEILDKFLPPYKCWQCQNNAPPDHLHTINPRDELKTALNQFYAEEMLSIAKTIPGLGASHPHLGDYISYSELEKALTDWLGGSSNGVGGEK